MQASTNVECALLEQRFGVGMNGLRGKVAIITGAASGIGQATALKLAKYGTIILVGRNPKKLDDWQSFLVPCQAVLRIMERKGQVAHRQEGRAFVFHPLISRGDRHRLSIRHLLARYFTGSRSELLVELLSDERISREELSKLEELVRNRRKELSLD